MVNLIESNIHASVLLNLFNLLKKNDAQQAMFISLINSITHKHTW